MNKLVSILLFLVFAGQAFAADTWVNGYYRQNGTYVQGHYRTAPDNNPYNNYSSQGNVNPYNGNRGTVNNYNSGNSLNSNSWQQYQQQNKIDWND